jgi:RimJ/RimL family protein N-acetyltransferase
MSRVHVEGDHVSLRPLRTDEFEAAWEARLDAVPSVQPILPKRDDLWARFARSGILQDGKLDLAIEVEGRCIGEIQTYLPPGRALPPGAFEVGIAIYARSMRGRGYGTEAVRLLVDWLFAEAHAIRVHMPTVPDNVAMRTVLERLGFATEGTIQELDQEFMLYVVTRASWATTRP